jgi:hypothetical protein
MSLSNLHFDLLSSNVYDVNAQTVHISHINCHNDVTTAEQAGYFNNPSQRAAIQTTHRNNTAKNAMIASVCIFKACVDLKRGYQILSPRIRCRLVKI